MKATIIFVRLQIPLSTLRYKHVCSFRRPLGFPVAGVVLAFVLPNNFIETVP